MLVMHDQTRDGFVLQNVDPWEIGSNPAKYEASKSHSSITIEHLKRTATFSLISLVPVIKVVS